MIWRAEVEEEVEREWGGSRLVDVDTAGQPGFHLGYEYQEGYEYHQGYDAQFQQGYQPEQPPQPHYVDAPEQHHVEPLQQQHPEQQHAEAVIKDEDEGFPRGSYDLSLLLDFGKHVAFKLWSDKTVSITIFYYL